MTFRQHLVSLCIMSGLCLAFFQASHRWIADAWMRMALNPEINDLLLQAMLSQKRLAELEPDKTADYRRQYDQTRALLAHLEVLRTSRQPILTRFQAVLVALFAVSLLSIVSIQLWGHRRLDQRLTRLRGSLQRLAAGEPVRIDTTRGDLIGKIEKMIEDTSQVWGRRLKMLETLERWQESSRRLAHEIRTPLTAMQIELKKLHAACKTRCTQFENGPAHSIESISEELGRLSEFTEEFTALAKIRQPSLKRESLARFVDEFRESYANVWPNIGLAGEAPAGPSPEVFMDRRMVRQVLVNLCDNSSAAIGSRKGTVSLRTLKEAGVVVLSVKDNGPGISDSLRDRLFEPYVTTKPVGEGMGLGLAIAKKIMLDHRGDLVLHETGLDGTEFRLLFPVTD
ncbi:MAG: HAMP domain-containing sensor histidine kinase [Acidobacteriota bacterium]